MKLYLVTTLWAKGDDHYASSHLRVDLSGKEAYDKTVQGLLPQLEGWRLMTSTELSVREVPRSFLLGVLNRIDIGADVKETGDVSLS